MGEEEDDKDGMKGLRESGAGKRKIGRGNEVEDKERRGRRLGRGMNQGKQKEMKGRAKYENIKKTIRKV